MIKNQLIYMLMNKKLKLKEIDKLQLKKQMMIKKEQMLKLKKLKLSSSHKLQEKKLSLKRKLLQLKLQKRNTKNKSLIFSQNCKLFIMKELKKKMLQEQRKKQNTKLNWLHLLPIKRKKEKRHQPSLIKKNLMKNQQDNLRKTLKRELVKKSQRMKKKDKNEKNKSNLKKLSINN